MCLLIFFQIKIAMETWLRRRGKTKAKEIIFAGRILFKATIMSKPMKKKKGGVGEELRIIIYLK